MHVQMSVHVLPRLTTVDHSNVIRVAIPQRLQLADKLGAIRFRRRGGNSSLFNRSLVCRHPSGEAYLLHHDLGQLVYCIETYRTSVN